MNRKIIGLLVGLIVIVSAVLVFSVLRDDTMDITDDENGEISTNDVLAEINENLLGEDDAVEIGELI